MEMLELEYMEMNKEVADGNPFITRKIMILLNLLLALPMQINYNIN